ATEIEGQIRVRAENPPRLVSAVRPKGYVEVVGVHTVVRRERVRFAAEIGQIGKRAGVKERWRQLRAEHHVGVFHQALDRVLALIGGEHVAVARVDPEGGNSIIGEQSPEWHQVCAVYAQSPHMATIVIRENVSADKPGKRAATVNHAASNNE